jgi:predicted ArsR family transcriptional regulator
MQTTREIILTELKKRGQARADDLAEVLGVTSMAVRQHLYQLRDEGAVACCTTPGGRGRPAKHWELTEKSDVYFQGAHRDLSLDLIASMRTLFGEEGLDKLVSHRTAQQQARYEAAAAGKTGLRDRLASLAGERTREGYMAEVTEGEDGALLLLENHCPICEAAKACSGLCSKELALFKSLFRDAEVERVEHVLKGGRRCAYRVTPKT